MKSSAQIITPGKVKFTTRQRHVDALKYVAKEYGPNKACSTFVVGLEPVESFLEGAEALARDGIVAMASLWIPFGRPVMGNAKAPGLDYYQKVKLGLAEIYQKYGIVPPGGAGFNVDIDKDIWQHRKELSQFRYCLVNIISQSPGSNALSKSDFCLISEPRDVSIY